MITPPISSKSPVTFIIPSVTASVSSANPNNSHPISSGLMLTYPEPEPEPESPPLADGTNISSLTDTAFDAVENETDQMVERAATEGMEIEDEVLSTTLQETEEVIMELGEEMEILMTAATESI